MSIHVLVPVGELYSPADGTPLYKPYGYVSPQRVCFFALFRSENVYRPGAIIGVGDRKCTPFSNKGVDSIEIAICAIFSTNSAISCDTRVLLLRGCRAKDEQTKRRGNYLRRR